MPRRLPEAPEGGVQAALCGKHRQGRWFESTIRDLFSIEPEKIRDVKVVATMVGGKAVYGALPGK